MKLELGPLEVAPAPHIDAEVVFSHLTGRWSLQILLALNEGPLRFSSLRRAIPKVSANVLTARLRELETAQLVVHRLHPPPAACHAYELGPLAKDLRPALFHLERWKSHLANTEAAITSAKDEG